MTDAFLFLLASLATFRMAEMIAFDAGPFRVFGAIRDAFRRHQLFTCYACQSSWWAIVATYWLWQLDLIPGNIFPIYAAAVAGVAVTIFRVLPDRK